MHVRQLAHPFRRNLAVAACAALVLASCGGDDDAADITVPDIEPGSASPATTEPGMTEPDMTQPDTGDVIDEGVVCAASEDGGPLDLEALADVDAASALGQIDGASTFLFVTSEAGVTDALASDAGLTLFVPTDDAFDLIPEDELQSLLSDPAALSSVVLRHIVTGTYTSSDLEDAMTLPTMSDGEELIVSVADDGAVSLDGSAATVVCPDIETSNAVIHLIDQVILTPGGVG